jgi:molybdopterin-guanine dinucleotide biosynthesis protein B
MRVFGIIGNCRGKAELIHRLIAQLQLQGLSVSTIKRVSDDVDLDRPGKDSYQQRLAGAQEVVMANSFRLAILQEYQLPRDEPDVDTLIDRLTPVDLVLLEGFHLSAYPKLEVINGGQDRRPHYRDDPTVIAVTTVGTGIPETSHESPICLKNGDIAALAAFVSAHAVPAGQIYAEAVA